MKIILLMVIFISSLMATTKVVVSYPYIESILKEIAKDKIEVDSLSNGRFDPHFVMAKPSLIVKMKNADALIINGGQLEIGWIPGIIKSANNRKITKDGHFLELANVVPMIDANENVSRADGDVHPDGNPHFIFDPHNVLLLSSAMEDFLSKLDKKNSSFYKDNLKEFQDRWRSLLVKWDKKMKTVNTSEVIQYHHLHDYFLNRYNIKTAGTIEPIPGVTASVKHTFKLIRLVKERAIKKIIISSYNSPKGAEFIASKTNATVIVMPHDVVKSNDIFNIEDMFDTMVESYVK